MPAHLHCMESHFPERRRCWAQREGSDLLRGYVPGIAPLGHWTGDHNLSLWDSAGAGQKYGGWDNRKLVGFFERYCKVLFERYKDQVKYWMTFNEINNTLKLPYLAAVIPVHRSGSIRLHTICLWPMHWLSKPAMRWYRVQRSAMLSFEQHIQTLPPGDGNTSASSALLLLGCRCPAGRYLIDRKWEELGRTGAADGAGESWAVLQTCRFHLAFRLPRPLPTSAGADPLLRAVTAVETILSGRSSGAAVIWMRSAISCMKLPWPATDYVHLLSTQPWYSRLMTRMAHPGYCPHGVPPKSTSKLCSRLWLTAVISSATLGGGPSISWVPALARWKSRYDFIYVDKDNQGNGTLQRRKKDSLRVLQKGDRFQRTGWNFPPRTNQIKKIWSSYPLTGNRNLWQGRSSFYPDIMNNFTS